MANLKQQWSYVSDQPISEQAILALHVPPEQFRAELHPAEARQQIVMKSPQDFVLYVLEGACRTTIDGAVLDLNAGEFVFLGKGAYNFKAGKDGLRSMLVAAK